MTRFALTKGAIAVFLSVLIISVGILFLLGAQEPTAEDTDLSNVDIAYYNGEGAWGITETILSSLLLLLPKLLIVRLNEKLLLVVSHPQSWQ
jgi:hypothetical protein